MTSDIEADKDLFNSFIHKIYLMHQQKAARDGARGYKWIHFCPMWIKHTYIACRYKVENMNQIMFKYWTSCTYCTKLQGAARDGAKGN